MTSENRIIAIGAGDTGVSSHGLGTIGVADDPHDALIPEDFGSPELGANMPNAWDEDDGEVAAQGRISGWLVPALATLALLAWTAFLIHSRWAQLGVRPSAASVADAIVAWSMPAAAIGVAWLLAMRNSTREVRRFGDAARALSSQSLELENRLCSVNRELSIAREFLGAQTRDLETLGRLATERLSQNAEQLNGLIADNGARIDSIGTVSRAALENMEKLRGQLPVIVSSAKDLTNNIANAGRTAHTQIEDMIGGFNRLNDFGTASERQIANVQTAVEQALGEFNRQCEQLAQLADHRFAELGQRSEAYRTTLDGIEIEALAAMRQRMSALDGEIEQTRGQLEAHEAESLVSLRSRMAALRDETDVISRALNDEQTRQLEAFKADWSEIEEKQRHTGDALIDVYRARIDDLSARIASLEAFCGRIDQGVTESNLRLSEEMEARRVQLASIATQTATSFAAELTALEQRLDEHQQRHVEHAGTISARSSALNALVGEVEERFAQMTDRTSETELGITATISALVSLQSGLKTSLDQTDGDIARLTNSSVRLLELIQASARHAQDRLPEALAHSEQRLNHHEAKIQSLVAALARSVSDGSALADSIAACETHIIEIDRALEQVQDRFGERAVRQSGELEHLRGAIESIEASTERTAIKARDELAAALAMLADAHDNALAAMQRDETGRIQAFANSVGGESARVLDGVMQERIEDISRRLEQTVTQAATASQTVAAQLRDHLAGFEMQIGTLEARVSAAKERARQEVENDFARRVAVITESLNSNGIDIAAALAQDIADTAWASYLRGDRSIFTRRAVSLLESGEARSIQHVYENDGAFREQVSRYIHDFEAILREVLSTRDGNALAVTLLSSDMGKLYVALAQAIERLRA